MGRNISSSSDYFGAEVGEFISFSVELNGAENEIIQQYLSAKFNIGLSGTDYYAGHATDYTIGVQGIGTSDGTANHVESEASDDLSITTANGSFNAANEYVFVGHNEPNDGGTTADLSRLASVETRFSRVWYLDETGTVDVKLTFDIVEGTGSATFPAGTGYALLYSPTSGPFVFEDWTADNSIAPSVNEERISFEVTSTHLADGYYTVGSTDEVDSPLPVHLLSFDVENCDNEVCIQWITASEKDNDYFTLEKSRDAIEWDLVELIDGNGTTSKKREYNYLDQRDYSGQVYYRLSQTDFDGTREDHGIRVVNPIWSLADLKLMPNPNEGRFVIKSPNSLDKSIISMQIFNSIGRSVNFKRTILNNEIQFDISNNPLGIYLLKIILDGQTKVFRVKRI